MISSPIAPSNILLEMSKRKRKGKAKIFALPTKLARGAMLVRLMDHPVRVCSKVAFARRIRLLDKR